MQRLRSVSSVDPNNQPSDIAGRYDGVAERAACCAQRR